MHLHNSREPSRDAHFVAVILVAIIAVPNILGIFWTPGICATFEIVFGGKPLPHATQWLRSANIPFMILAGCFPAVSLWFYNRSYAASFTAGLLLVSLFLSVFIGLALYSPIILITREMALN